MSNKELELKLKYLEFFRVAYEERNGIQAAVRAGVDHSYMVKSLKRLEGIYGGKLFAKQYIRNQTMQPTPLADRIYPVIRDMLDSYTNLVNNCRDFNLEKEKTYHVAATDYFTSVIAGGLDASLRATAPNNKIVYATVPITDDVHLQNSILNRIGDQVFDVLVYHSTGVFGDTLIYEEILEDQWVFITNKNPFGESDVTLRGSLAQKPFLGSGIKAVDQQVLSLCPEIREYIPNDKPFFQVPESVIVGGYVGMIPRQITRSKTLSFRALEMFEPSDLGEDAVLESYKLYMFYKAVNRNDNEHKFLRNKIVSASKSLG